MSATAGSSSAPRFVVGIDLGTTNSAVAYAEPGARADVQAFPIPQLVAPGEVRDRPMVPSAIYLAGEHDVPAGELALPWRQDEREVVGELARGLGERVAGRLITSAKSWLCHAQVDRTAAILPWGGIEGVKRLSPVDASARILTHVRNAWDAAHPDSPLAEQDVIVTVPASFDEVARELTVEAASRAGLPRIRLLEEPQAAIYAWIARNEDWRELLAGCARVLVVDVGGGTSDFSLIAVRNVVEGLALERVAVGEHVLLGGDNMDLALARLIVSRQASARDLDAARFQQLTALCREAKERLLGSSPPESAPIALAGRGRGVIRDVVRDDLTVEDVARVVIEGFFPVVALDERPASQPDLGLAEFGLPFASDPAVTRHLASFLGHHGVGASEAVPDAVLFNGGALKPRAVRTRIASTLEGWSGKPPHELAGGDLDLSVSRGAAAFGLALRGLAVRIAGGAPRAYYVGLGGENADRDDSVGTGEGGAADVVSAPARLLCIAPRGMEEEESAEIHSPTFEVTTNAPVRFPIFASSTRSGDAAGAIIAFDPEEIVALPPITARLRYGKSLEARTIPVHLRVHLMSTGTLELWCLSRQSEHRWKLAFDLRGRSVADPSTGAASGPRGVGSLRDAQELILSEDRVQGAEQLLEECFGQRSAGDPVALMRRLEEALGAGRDAWPITAIRRLWDALFALEPSRSRSPAYEARWLNLAGFLLRPGYGEERDPWRAERLWRLFDRGPESPGAAQVRAEWWSLWKRVAGGLTRQQQQALLQEIRPALLPAARSRGKGGRRVKAGPQEVREMWQVAASLERIPAQWKSELAAELASRVVRGKASEIETWAFGRLLAREPVHGPVNTVVEPSAIETWIGDLAEASWSKSGPTALALAQAARLTGDRARDLSQSLREKVATRLEREDSATLARWVREVVPLDAGSQALVLADSLPVGLRIVEAVNSDET